MGGSKSPPPWTGSAYHAESENPGTGRNTACTVSIWVWGVRPSRSNGRNPAGAPNAVIAHDPEGLFLSNGPGDPAATGEYAVPMIRTVLENSDIPIFGICLGHQMLALALGARTIKMNHGHHGANHPVKEIRTGRVQITSMNHGFTVDSQTLPTGVIETHVSLFDGSNCGIATEDGRVFSVQHHPEASPGPHDLRPLFQRFTASMKAYRHRAQAV